jgi:hypothetical protein
MPVCLSIKMLHFRNYSMVLHPYMKFDVWGISKNASGELRITGLILSAVQYRQNNL